MIKLQTGNDSYAERLQKASKSRHEAVQQCFQSEGFSLTSLMGPISDGPEWPSDASWLALQHDNCACIISDGLSDPWVERYKSGTGLGLEVFAESPDINIGQFDSAMDMADTWLFPMIAEISHTLAGYPRLCGKLLVGEPLSIRFNIEHIKDGRGLVGALLHAPKHFNASINTSMGTIPLIAATLLTGSELRWLAGRGLEGRTSLLDTLYQKGINTQSLLDRDPVV